MPSLAALGKSLAGLRPRTGIGALESKKTAVVTLRWLLVIAAAYLMLFNGQHTSPLGVAIVVVLMLASNVIIARLPEKLVAHSAFDPILLLHDTVLLSVGFYLTETISSDFYLLYFFVIFLAGVSEKLTSVLLGSILASIAYLSLAWSGLMGAPAVLLSGSLVLRLFFIVAVALFYGYFVERLRLDRATRQIEYVAQLESVNERLRELAELKQAFVGSVSHELRTPLQAMLGYIDLVRDGAVGEVSGTVWAYVDRAHRGGLQLMQLIEELLNFANLSHERVEVRLADTDIRALLEEVRAHTQPLGMKKGLAVHFERAPDVDHIVTDGGKLVQILVHLVTNAVKFTEKGAVRVSVDRCRAVLSSGWRGTVLEWTVEDTGPGMSAEQLAVIFEEFRQLDGSMARRHQGMGLGLSVCRGLVQLLRGDIAVESTVGKGTVFIVRVPIESAPALRLERPAAESPPEATVAAVG